MSLQAQHVHHGRTKIVTDNRPRTYVDASYSYGSFNTHRSNLALGWTSKRGFMLRFNAYQNYSDNDYKVKTQWTDLATSDILDLGNNRLAMTLYYSTCDSAAVVFTDYSFSTISDPAFDARIGGIYGAWRSARYSMGGVADDGTAYVFCGTSSNDSKVGALRIKSSDTS